MKTHQLDAFIAIAEGLGVAGAADLLCVSQPAITKSINNLEDELGVRLFERTSNRLQLNQYGEMLLLRAKVAKTELSRASEEIQLLKNHLKSVVKFNASPLLVPKLIPKAINLFREEYPNVNIELAGMLEGKPEYKIQSLLNGEYDLLITVIDENDPNLGISYEKLLDVEVKFIASKGHPALDLKNPTLKELRKFNWLFPGAGGLPYQKLRAAFKSAKTDMPADVLILSNRQITFKLLEEGMYIAAIPYNSTCFERDLSQFEQLNVKNNKISWPIYLIWRENSKFSVSMNAFVKQIKTLASINEKSEK